MGFGEIQHKISQLSLKPAQWQETVGFKETEWVITYLVILEIRHDLIQEDKVLLFNIILEIIYSSV